MTDDDRRLSKPIHISILKQDGEVRHIAHCQQEPEQASPLAQSADTKVLYPFRNTQVHSDAWKASEHVRLEKRK